MTRRRDSIDLSADVGEGCRWDDELLARITSANVSCGAHAGDRETILHALELAAIRGVVVGAHPGYPDRVAFGRGERHDSSDAICEMILAQIDRLTTLSATVGVPIRFVKPHGALYNQAQIEPLVANGVGNAVSRLGLPLVGMPGSELARVAREMDLVYVTEGFADRAYGSNGFLVPRGFPGAILYEVSSVHEQVLRLIEAGVDTICLHGDNPHALELADSILSLLRTNNIPIRPLLQ